MRRSSSVKWAFDAAPAQEEWRCHIVVSRIGKQDFGCFAERNLSYLVSLRDVQYGYNINDRPEAIAADMRDRPLARSWGGMMPLAVPTANKDRLIGA